jgi:hypothetical protein
MKTKSILLFFMLLLFCVTSFAQEKSKKEIRKERRIEQQKKTEALVNTKNFMFVANRAIPQGYPIVDLISNPNHMKFSPELIDSYMPFFGRAYQVNINQEGGFKFTAKPESYDLVKTKKGYELKVKVKDKNDTYDIFLNISPEGTVLLTISSNNRSTISYNGEIEPLPDTAKEIKK